MAERLTGKVKFYHRRKGYGFIIAPEADVATTNGIFVHRTAIYRRDLVFPSEGEIVTYEVTKDESDRPKAINVERPNAETYVPKPRADRAPRAPRAEGEAGASRADGDKKKRVPRRRPRRPRKTGGSPAAGAPGGAPAAASQ